jgi:regulator of replication initiation timing
MDYNSIFTLFSTAITGVITFFIGLRRGKAETESVVLSNLEKAVSVYKTIIDDMKEELTLLRMEVDKLEQKVQELLKENAELKKIMLSHEEKSAKRAKTPVKKV